MASSVVVNTGVARALSNGLVIEMIVTQAAIETYDVMIDNISKTSGSGKGYKRNGAVHIASAPGQYPTKDSGLLVNNIKITNPQGISFGTKSPDVLIELPAQPSLELEYGTSKMQSRPFIIRSLNEAFSTRFDKIIRNVIKTLESAPQLFAMLQKTTSGVRRARAASRRRRRSAP
jgi:hypothetical protein